MHIETPVMITFLGYLALMMGIGLWAYKATDSVDDYILGGRKMGPAVTALSVGASDMSGWLLLGLPGAVYLGGLGEAWMGIGLLLGAWLNWLLVAKRLRIYTQMADNALTLPDFFEKRFNDKGGLLKLVSAVTILLFFTFYASSGMVGGAVLFSNVFGFDYLTALLIGSTVIVAYTFVGGFFAVSWTDFFQGCLMLIALLIVPVSMFTQPESHQSLDALDPAMLSLWSDKLSLIGLLSALAWGLGYFGQPHILSRFMAINSVKDLPVSRRIAMSWMFVSLIGALATGIAGALYFADEPLKNPETVFIHLTQVAFNPWIGGLLIAAIAIISVVVALDREASVLGLVSYAWAGFGAAFGPVVILSLFWRGYSRNGAIATILVGGLTVIIWKQLESGIFALYEILPGFILATLAGVVVSLLSPPSEVTEAQFNRFEQSL
jgi:sodium/proline symporter